MKNKAKPLYHQRQPVPVSMWLPWSKGFKANWFDKPTFELSGTKVAPLICYETFLVWPVLHAVSQNPSVLLVTGNLWWAKNTTLPQVQKSVALSWASLFKLNLIFSVNT